MCLPYGYNIKYTIQQVKVLPNSILIKGQDNHPISECSVNHFDVTQHNT